MSSSSDDFLINLSLFRRPPSRNFHFSPFNSPHSSCSNSDSERRRRCVELQLSGMMMTCGTLKLLFLVFCRFFCHMSLQFHRCYDTNANVFLLLGSKLSALIFVTRLSFVDGSHKMLSWVHRIVSLNTFSSPHRLTFERSSSRSSSFSVTLLVKTNHCPTVMAPICVSKCCSLFSDCWFVKLLIMANIYLIFSTCLWHTLCWVFMSDISCWRWAY